MLRTGILRILLGKIIGNSFTAITMKLTILLFMISLGVSANSYSQSTKVSIALEHESIDKLFQEIRKQTDYGFFFNDQSVGVLNDVTINKKNASVEEVLDEVFAATDYTYKIVNGVIIVNKKEAPAPTQPTSKMVRGHIRDAATGESLIGVTVAVWQSALGASTDFDGNFNLRVPMEKDSIMVSYIGYETQVLAISNQAEIFLNIILEPAIEEIDEVVVTGYQVINKTELTSAISTVSAKELDRIGATSIDQMLEGKATGLMISTISSTPGAAAKVRVRASSTFTGNQSPLWVIDGVIYEDPVPLTADEINSFDNVNLIGNALTGINPQDIESINVLKDASATAIYGTQAANGVIVITTKRGEVGKTTLNFSTSMSIVDRPRYNKMYLMNSKERIDVSREMYERNLGMVSSYDNVDNLGYEGALNNLWNGTYSYSEFQEQVNYLETLNSDWFGALYQPAINQQYSLSASGGAKNLKYYFSVGFDDQQGTEIGTGLQRITSRSNIDLNLTDKMLLSLQFSGSVQDAEYNHSSVDVFDEAYYTSRTIPIYDEDGGLFYQSQLVYDGAENIYGDYNILNEINNSAKNVTNKDLAISANLNWKFWPGFRYMGMFSYRNTTNITEEYITEETFYIAKLRTYMDYADYDEENVAADAMVPFGGLYGSGVLSQDAYTVRNQVNYNKVINSKHVINVNVGQEARSTKYHGSQGWLSPGFNYSQGWSFVELPDVGYVAGTGLDLANYNYQYMINWLTGDGSYDIYPTIVDRVKNTLSVFSIMSYIYDNKYILNFNIRSDGSNTFGQYERYKFKPVWSTSARWNIHKENFMENIGLFDELSLRASYGFRGSMPNASPYLLIEDYGRGEAAYYPETVASLSAFPNASLRWEKTSTFNAGLNYAILAGRISGVLDYSYSLSTDLLQSRPISLVNGSSTYTYNSGSKDVSSIEFSLRTVNVKTKSFSWSTNFNYSFEKDRVLEGFEAGVTSTTVSNYLNGSIYRTGFPTSGFFSYQLEGLNEEGLPVFKNLYDEEDGTILEHMEKVLKYEGTRVPNHYGGFGTEVRYKSLALRANFTYKLGYKTRLLKLYPDNQSMPLPYENMRAEFVDRWREPGDEAHTNIPVLSNETYTFSNSTDPDDYLYTVSNLGYVVPTGRNAWWMYNYSDARVVRGDHIRWTSLSLSYRVSQKVLEKVKLGSATVTAQMSNIYAWAFDKRLKGQDPEQVDGVGLPNLPTYSMRINVSF